MIESSSGITFFVGNETPARLGKNAGELLSGAFLVNERKMSLDSRIPLLGHKHKTSVFDPFILGCDSSIGGF